MADIVFIEPNDDHSYRQSALVLKVEDDHLLVACAHPDVHLAGHLDIVLHYSPTLPCSLAVFTHAVAWVPRSSVASTFGSVPDDVIDTVFDCRVGIAPPPVIAGTCDPLKQVSLVTKWFDVIKNLEPIN